MLCFAPTKDISGEICTNRCPDRQTCTKKRIPLLIEALDILASEIEIEEKNGLFFTSFKSYCIAPEAYINGIVFEMSEPAPTKHIHVKCHRPGCGNFVMMPVSQEEELMTDNYTKYNKNTYIYCSKDCQERHITKLAEAKSIASGTLKNHEYAIVIHGADTTKRLKEKEVHVITGTVTEQQARCLKEKLESLTPRQKRKFLMSKDVKLYFLKDVSDHLKINESNAHRDAYRIMNKCRELFPDAISIKNFNKKVRYIELIN